MTKRNRKVRQPSQPRPRGGSRKWLYFGIAGAIALVVGLGAVLATRGGGSSQGGAPPTGGAALPTWLARAPAQVREAYAYAVEHPETTSYVPCYCGCGIHDGHRSAQECFVAARPAGSPLVYDQHGAGCDMCVDIALMVKRTMAGGGSLREARLAVDKKYSWVGPPTDTPPLP